MLLSDWILTQNQAISDLTKVESIRILLDDIFVEKYLNISLLAAAPKSLEKHILHFIIELKVLFKIIPHVFVLVCIEMLTGVQVPIEVRRGI